MISGRQWRSIVATAVVLAAVFAAAAGAGFLFEHEPAPDERRIAIDREPPPPGPEAFLGGEVVSVGEGRLSLRTSEGVVEIAFGGDVVVDELRRVSESRFTPGDAVNLGGEQSDFGLVLSGVVAIDAP